MTVTAQPSGAAESDFAIQEQELQEAAGAFKAALGQTTALTPPPKRDESGRFASDDDGAEDEIDTPDEAEAADEAAQAEAGDDDAGDDGGDDDEAAEEAQPDDVGLPKSWPTDKAELWESLDADAQAYIRQRDAEQESAVNAKFMEAANLRKAHEAEINEARNNRQRYAEAVDQVMSLIIPQRPPRSMLDRTSTDFDPDQFHHLNAIYEDQVNFLTNHAVQRREAVAQEQFEAVQTLNAATRDPFIAAVPDVADPAKAQGVFQGLIDYAVSQGAPAEVFDTPTSALEWHVLWKAREYDRLQSAKAKVATDPKPAPRKAQPAVRPGVSTPKKAIEQARRTKAMERLDSEGTVEAGAAAFKHLLKGKLS